MDHRSLTIEKRDLSSLNPTDGEDYNWENLSSMGEVQGKRRQKKEHASKRNAEMRKTT